MAQTRDLRSILFIFVAVVGLIVVWRDLRYDFNFVDDMHAAMMARATQDVTATVTETILQTDKTFVTETI
ncbi:hypothetical protein H4R20_003513, partial [Coemansia guatemalensis]